jgi:hypothetical protein
MDTIKMSEEITHRRRFFGTAPPLLAQGTIGKEL